MNWYERRAEVLALADQMPGYGYLAKLDGERHIGRVVINRRGAFGYRSGFYPSTGPICALLDALFAQRQKQLTMSLPK